MVTLTTAFVLIGVIVVFVLAIALASFAVCRPSCGSGSSLALPQPKKSWGVTVAQAKTRAPDSVVLLDQREIDAQYAVLSLTMDVLRSAQVPFYAIGGTALGALRHGGFMLHDDDVDLGIDHRFMPLVAALQPRFAANGLEILWETRSGYGPYYLTKVQAMDNRADLKCHPVDLIWDHVHADGTAERLNPQFEAPWRKCGSLLPLSDWTFGPLSIPAPKNLHRVCSGYGFRQTDGGDMFTVRAVKLVGNFRKEPIVFTMKEKRARLHLIPSKPLPVATGLSLPLNPSAQWVALEGRKNILGCPVPSHFKDNDTDMPAEWRTRAAQAQQLVAASTLRDRFSPEVLDMLPGVKTVFIEGSGTMALTDMREPIQSQMAPGNAWEPELQAIMRETLRPGDVAMDLGTYNGIHSVCMARVVGPSGLVICAEPNPDTFPQLHATLAVNGVSRWCRTYNVGVSSSESGSTRFELNRGGSAVVSDVAKSKHKTVRVALTTADALCAHAGLTPKQRVAFVKIDTEGHERAVLEGLANTLRRDRPVVAVEVWRDRRAGEDAVPQWLCRTFGYRHVKDVYSDMVFAPKAAAMPRPLRPRTALIISAHAGTTNIAQYAAWSAGLACGVWTPKLPGQPGACYDYTKANCGVLWGLVRDQANKADLIITTDPTPCARIVLDAEGRRPPVLVWVTNRFNYGFKQDAQRLAWHDELSTASTRKDVGVAWSTPFEREFAERSGARITGEVLKSTGCQGARNTFGDLPHRYHKAKARELVWVPPYENERRFNIVEGLTAAGIPHQSGPARWGGPAALRKMRAILHFPYAPTTTSLWENIGVGAVYVIPSAKLVKELMVGKDGYWMQDVRASELETTEWYRPENAGLFRTFDTWPEGAVAALRDLRGIEETRRTITGTIWPAHVEQHTSGWIATINRLVT